MLKLSSCTLLTSALLSGVATAQVTMTELLTVNLDPASMAGSSSFIGSNPSAIAWNGTDLFAAGFNNSGSANDVGIVKVSDVFGAQTIGDAFGVQVAPAFRGYSGLDISAGTLAAAYDDGALHPDGITHWDQAGLALWSKDARGGSGVGYDPGFPGGNPAVGSGVGWTTFGVGRRALQQGVTGADIWTTTDGMVINTPEGTFWRDMDFDPDTGDAWLREGNNLIHVVRSGDNASSSQTVVVDDDPDADFVNGQNVAFMNAGAGNFIVYNDRPVTSTGQQFFNVVKIIAPDGSTPTVDWGGFAPLAAAGFYDFSWHEESETLAVLNFTSRNVTIFQFAVSNIGMNYCVAVANSTGSSAIINATGSLSVADNSVVLSAEPVPDQPGLFFYGPAQTQVGFGNGFRCVDGVLGRLDVINGTNNNYTFPLDITDPPSVATQITAGSTWHFQCWYRDPMAGGAFFNLSDATTLVFGP